MKTWVNRVSGLLLIALLSGVPEVCQAQAQQPSAPASPASPTTGAAGSDTALPDNGNATQSSNGGTATGQAQETSQTPAELPDSPSQARTQNASPDAQNADSPSQVQPSATTSTQTTTATPADQNPAGAAAAQRGKTAGGAASRPAGAALAPEKQKSPKSLLIKLGILAGAGIALGTVYALSQASPSRPPGAK